MIWKPNVTVAGVICRDGEYLLVEEETDEGAQFNQPAGHLEQGESLLAAVAREVQEETGYRFRPDFLLGVYLWPHPRKDLSYLRFAFGGEIVGHDPGQPLDDGIIAAHWLTPAKMRETAARHRSPLVLRCVEDHLAGRAYPLELLAHY